MCVHNLLQNIDKGLRKKIKLEQKKEIIEACDSDEIKYKAMEELQKKRHEKLKNMIYEPDFKKLVDQITNDYK